LFSPIKFLFTQIKELANEALRAYVPSQPAVKSSQPQMIFFAKIGIYFQTTKLY